MATTPSETDKALMTEFTELLHQAQQLSLFTFSTELNAIGSGTVLARAAIYGEPPSVDSVAIVSAHAESSITFCHRAETQALINALRFFLVYLEGAKQSADKEKRFFLAGFLATGQGWNGEHTSGNQTVQEAAEEAWKQFVREAEDSLR